jgi:hypothetical protein
MLRRGCLRNVHDWDLRHIVREGSGQSAGLITQFPCVNLPLRIKGGDGVITAGEARGNVMTFAWGLLGAVTLTITMC